MTGRKPGLLLAVALCALFCLFLCGCGVGKTAGEAEVSFRPAPVETAVFHEAEAEVSGDIAADFSALPHGYAAICARSGEKLKLQVICGGQTYTYDLNGDGTAQIFPMNLGSGTYTFRILQNLSGDKYTQIWSAEKEVALESEFAPYLRPNVFVSYDEDSACVSYARELAQGCERDVDVVSAIYAALVEDIVYDDEKAKTVASGYVPVPDETLASGSGICFDYAALAAAMLRSLGIPCRVVTGYVGEDEVYHAWNEIYLESAGWITVKIAAGANDWKRVDITFAAGGVADRQLDDDARYTTRYTY